MKKRNNKLKKRMHSTEHKQRRPFRLLGYLLFLIAVFALFDIFMTSQCSNCGCTLQSRLKSILSVSKKKHAKSVKPLFVTPTTTGPKPAREDDQDSSLDEKIPLFLDYPTPASSHNILSHKKIMTKF